MKVRMTLTLSGLHDGKPWPPEGETATVSDADGADLITAGLAVPVKRGEETAEQPEAETATPARKKRK